MPIVCNSISEKAGVFRARRPPVEKEGQVVCRKWVWSHQATATATGDSCWLGSLSRLAREAGQARYESARSELGLHVEGLPGLDTQGPRRMGSGELTIDRHISGDRGDIKMKLIQPHATKDNVFDAAHARDRWIWVTKARSLAASTREQHRDGGRSGFYLALPHQVEKPRF